VLTVVIAVVASDSWTNFIDDDESVTLKTNSISADESDIGDVCHSDDASLSSEVCSRKTDASGQDEEQQDTELLQSTKPRTLKTVIARLVMGRLGNHLWAFMSSLAIGVKFGLVNPVCKETKDYLSKYFRNIERQVKTLEEDYCFFNEAYDQLRTAMDTYYTHHYQKLSGLNVTVTRKGASSTIHPVEVVYKHGLLTHYELFKLPDFRRKFVIEYSNFPPNCPYKWRPFYGNKSELVDTRGEAFLMLNDVGDKTLYSNFTVGQTRLLTDSFFDQLQLKESLLDKAQETLQRIKAEHLHRHKGQKVKASEVKKGREDFVYVGIHARRTDHLEYEQKRNMVNLRPGYYLDAMRLFRQKFKKASKKKRLVFVYVSDDSNWGREKLGRRVKEGDLHFNPDGLPGDEGSIGHDLAVLASCNHTIVSHGSFSYFAGAFAGGIVVNPDHFEDYRDPKHQDVDVIKRLSKNPLDHPLPRLYFH